MTGFVGYDSEGRFVHYCHCGKWGAFGVDVRLAEDKLGAWYCREHKPERKQTNETSASPR